jgi:hypothetical protein
MLAVIGVMIITITSGRVVLVKLMGLADMLAENLLGQEREGEE